MWKTPDTSGCMPNLQRRNQTEPWVEAVSLKEYGDIASKNMMI